MELQQYQLSFARPHHRSGRQTPGQRRNHQASHRSARTPQHHFPHGKSGYAASFHPRFRTRRAEKLDRRHRFVFALAHLGRRRHDFRYGRYENVGKSLRHRHHQQRRHPKRPPRVCPHRKIWHGLRPRHRLLSRLVRLHRRNRRLQHWRVLFSERRSHHHRFRKFPAGNTRSRRRQLHRPRHHPNPLPQQCCLPQRSKRARQARHKIIAGDRITESAPTSHSAAIYPCLSVAIPSAALRHAEAELSRRREGSAFLTPKPQSWLSHPKKTRCHPEQREGSAFYAPEATLTRQDKIKKTSAFRQGTASAAEVLVPNP